jgi:3-oxoacyl-[acyl-carrier-protein] synthase III
MYIKDIASFVPNTLIPIEEYCAKINLPANQVQVLKRYHGLRQIPVAEGLTYFDLMYQPVRELLDRNDPRKVKYIIHVCVNPAWPFAHTAIAKLKEKTELWDAQCFSVSIHECASTVEALRVAHLLLRDEDEDNHAIIVASDWDFRPDRGIPNIPVTGDGGAALLLTTSPGEHRLLGAETTHNIEFANGIWMDKKEDIEYQKKFFSMVETNINRTLAQAHLNIQDLKLIVPLNSSLTSLWMLAKQLGINRDIFFTKNIGEMTHIFGADVIINLQRAVRESALQKGDYYLMFLIGASGSFGTAAFQY